MSRQEELASKDCWLVVKDTARGKSHIEKNIPNQDNCRTLPETDESAVNWCAAAVADGHGSPGSFRSDAGSMCAVAAALQILREVIAESPPDLAPLIDKLHKTVPARIVHLWRKLVLEDAARNPISPEPVSDDAVLPVYGSTLLCAAVTQKGALLGQLGDGDIVTVDGNGTPEWGIPPDETLLANVTTSLCLPQAIQDMRLRWVPRDAVRRFPTLILLSTDGYSNSFATSQDFLKVGTDILELLRTKGVDYIRENLRSWLSNASHQGSGDDVTLVLVGDCEFIRCKPTGPPVVPSLPALAVPNPVLYSPAPSPVVESLQPKPHVVQKKSDEEPSLRNRIVTFAQQSWLLCLGATACALVVVILSMLGFFQSTSPSSDDLVSAIPTNTSQDTQQQAAQPTPDPGTKPTTRPGPLTYLGKIIATEKEVRSVAVNDNGSKIAACTCIRVHRWEERPGGWVSTSVNDDVRQLTFIDEQLFAGRHGRRSGVIPPGNEAQPDITAISVWDSGKTIALGFDNGTVRIDGRGCYSCDRMRFASLPSKQPVISLQYPVPSTDQLIALSQDGTAYVCRPSKCRIDIIPRLQLPPAFRSATLVSGKQSGSCDLLAILDDGQLCWYRNISSDLPPPANQLDFSIAEQLTCVAVSANQQWLVGATKEGKIFRWDLLSPPNSSNGGRQ